MTLALATGCRASTPAPASASAGPAEPEPAAEPASRLVQESPDGDDAPTEPATSAERMAWRSVCVQRMAPRGPPRHAGMPGRVPRGVPTFTEPLDIQTCDWDRWQALLAKHPREDALYCVMVAQAEVCEGSDRALEWAEQRTAEFPESYDAWFFLGIERFRPLFPQPGSGLPYNDALPAAERLKIAASAAEAFDRAKESDPSLRDAWIWAGMAHDQRYQAYRVVGRPKTEEQRKRAIHARAAATESWRNQQRVCRIDGIPDCSERPGSDQPCCPPPPYSEAELAQDASDLAELDGE
jgi:tetratricopeptide (TPR) repeat protein